MRYFLSFISLLLLIEIIHSQVVFESLCSSDVEVQGMSSTDGNDDFEIDLYEAKFLPDDTVLCKKEFCCCFFLLNKICSSGNKTKTTELWY